MLYYVEYNNAYSEHPAFWLPSGIKGKKDPPDSPDHSCRQPFKLMINGRPYKKGKVPEEVVEFLKVTLEPISTRNCRGLPGDYGR